jgi:hypothetical protein
MTRLSTDASVMYTQQGEWKLNWTDWDEENDKPRDEWVLTIPSKLNTFLHSAKRSNIRHVFLYMRLYSKFFDNSGNADESKHANFLHIDLANKRMYRYEPSGYGLYEVFDMEGLDARLEKWAITKGLTYIPPYESCPRQLFAKLAAQQRVAGRAQREVGDPGVFCKTWASFMLEQKLRNPDISIVDLHDSSVKHFMDSNVDLNQFARYYTARVNQIGMDILARHGFKETNDKDDFLEKHWKKIMKA